MNYLKNMLVLIGFISLIGIQPLMAADETQIEAHAQEEFKVKDLILDHLGDSYEWHITNIGDKHISVPLPVIVKSVNGGWSIFMSSKLEHGHAQYNGFYISKSEKYNGKIVEKDASGEEVRPIDFSITKNAFALLLYSAILIIIVVSVANWYKKRAKRGVMEAPRGFVGFMEMFIMSVNDDIIKPCVGKNYKKFAPYLLTAFFFIFFCNLMGLIPIFPAGANLTGNIAITLVLATCTFLIVNIFGTKEYWREILWPDVPTWLKVPVPLMPAIEIVGMFTKPFALMIRLFANVLAGHSIVLGLTCLVFVTANLGVAINTSMSVVSVILSVFIQFVEILVAYIQAYVFTMLSAVFIGLAQVEPHHSKSEKH